MKYFLLSILLLTTKIIFCQIMPNDMLKIHRMNFDEFETFALQHKFEFNESITNDNYKELTFVNYINDDVHLLTLTIYNDSSKIVSYSPINGNEMLKIKNWISQNGFKFTKSDNGIPDGFSQSHMNWYKKNDYSFSLMTAIKNNKIYYNITLSKDY